MWLRREFFDREERGLLAAIGRSTRLQPRGWIMFIIGVWQRSVSVHATTRVVPVLVTSLLAGCGDVSQDRPAAYVSPHSEEFLARFPFSNSHRDCVELDPDGYIYLREAALLLAHHSLKGATQIEIIASAVVQCQGNATVLVFGLGENQGTARVWDLTRDFGTGEIPFRTIN